MDNTSSSRKESRALITHMRHSCLVTMIGLDWIVRLINASMLKVEVIIVIFKDIRPKGIYLFYPTILRRLKGISLFQE